MMSMENDSNKPSDNDQQKEKMQNLRNQVDSVKAVMVDNVERILERGERLDNIERRSEQLNATSANFKFTARKVQRKFCMLNAKWTVILSIVILIVFVVLLLLILHWTGVIGKRNND
ncbi:V-SNARE coiled-coil homology domain-containing protein [Caenorhabditis elegans]|uniref:V-SNARE coiled-coil homology domain-containing protein n=2 Tax=Caenorhabditis elegans TaxID=6239 RepID=Q95QZ1_CAEEL|nr:V-SNARE coiled-coil homology domain-containing protein [Caenorhabditis elegans]CAC70077.1 V-SNARE coiled-coil homology domain-containing protein [Caenorhabditis elegans]|eukprot:NP_001040904.1 VAMP (Vesicle Associated Membrane Protein) homolog [Caenorhabditis elegans]